MIKIQEQDRPDFIELATSLNITNQMNEVYSQQQQMIEQQIALNITPSVDKFGVSLFKALNTEAEEYNYNQKQNSVSNSFVQNNNSLTAASSVHHNNPNNVSSSQHPQFGLNQSTQHQGQPQTQIGTAGGLSLYGNTNNVDGSSTNPLQTKPNAFFPQSQYSQGASTFSQQPLAQSQAPNQQPQIPPANPKHQSLSRQQSQEALGQQGLAQPHNFANINQTPVNGVTLVKNNSQYVPANPHYSQTQIQYNLKPPSIPANQQSQYPNTQSSNTNNLLSQQPTTINSTITNIVQPNLSNPTQIQSSYLGPSQIQNPTSQSTYQPQNLTNPTSVQYNLQNQPYKLQPVTQPQTQYSYTGHLNLNQPSYEPSRTGISLASNPVNSSIPQPGGNNSQTTNYSIPEDVQKIINEFKEKQKQNDQLYSEKERLNQSNVKYQVVPKQDSPGQLQKSSSRNILNISPSNLTGVPSGDNVFAEQKKYLDLLQSQQQQPGSFYQPSQQLQQQSQIVQQLQGYPQQHFQIQQSVYQNPMSNSQLQAQQLVGMAPGLNLQKSSSQQGNQNISQLGGSQYNPVIQQSNNFSIPPTQINQPQQGIIGSNVFMSSDSQRNKYEHIHETYDDQSHYIGEKIGGLRHGTGKFFYADGGYYEGEWCEGRMEGLGTLYYPSGSLAYLGQWRNDQFNGKGTVYNESPSQIIGEFDYTNFDNLGEYWVKYEGDFKDDNKEGIGTIYLSNGDRFTGNFNNDFVHGQGTYFRENKNPVSGIWDCNHLIQYL